MSSNGVFNVILIIMSDRLDVDSSVTLPLADVGGRPAGEKREDGGDGGLSGPAPGTDCTD